MLFAPFLHEGLQSIVDGIRHNDLQNDALITMPSIAFWCPLAAQAQDIAAT